MKGKRAGAHPKVKTSAKSVQTTAEVSRKYYVLTNLSTRTHWNKYVVFILLLLLLKSPNGAILLHSPGRKPWVCCLIHLLSPVGAALPRRKTKFSRYSAAPTELILHLVRVSPGFHIGLCPHFTLGYAGVSPLQGLFVRMSNPKALDFTTLTLALLAALPYNGGIQTILKLTYCLKNQLFCIKVQT